LSRKKTEQFTKSTSFNEKQDLLLLEKINEKNKILEKLETNENF
jgi:hypothetical protein